jgi:Mlc titration factor MtfA (ptsG expression regulator)
MFASSRHRHRREVLAAGFTPEWAALLEESMAQWRLLNDAERERLGDGAVALLAAARWEAAHGFTLTDEITMLIAAEAALLGLGLDPGCWREVTSIVVHPTTTVVRRPHSAGGGIVSDDPLPILGEAAMGGPVVIAWDAARSQARHPEEGNNVVFHEFAHKLDMLTGHLSGTPPMGSPAQERQWVEVCTDVFTRVSTGPHPVLRPYAGVNPAEFFAVATEVFFDVPAALAHHEPDLYEVLAGYYRQDPQTRTPRNDTPLPTPREG